MLRPRRLPFQPGIVASLPGYARRRSLRVRPHQSDTATLSAAISRIALDRDGVQLNQNRLVRLQIGVTEQMSKRHGRTRDRDVGLGTKRIVRDVLQQGRYGLLQNLIMLFGK